VIGVGDGCKELGYFLSTEKEYIADGVLGRTTDSYDRVGIETATKPFGDVTEAQYLAALQEHFFGSIMQRAPPFSALKVQGERMSDLARKSADPESLRPEGRAVEVYALESLSFNPPFFRVRMRVGAGLYVRAILHDLGAVLGPGAYMSALTRTRVGEYRFEPTDLPPPGMGQDFDGRAANEACHLESEGANEVVPLGQYRYPVLPWEGVTAETIRRILKNQGSSNVRRTMAKDMSRKHSALRGGVTPASEKTKLLRRENKVRREGQGQRGAWRGDDTPHWQRGESQGQREDSGRSAPKVDECKGVPAQESASITGGRWGGFK
jgi:tRNA pseudouridine55 synthase